MWQRAGGADRDPPAVRSRPGRAGGFLAPPPGGAGGGRSRSGSASAAPGAAPPDRPPRSSQGRGQHHAFRAPSSRRVCRQRPVPPCGRRGAGSATREGRPRHRPRLRSRLQRPLSLRSRCAPLRARRCCRHERGPRRLRLGRQDRRG